MPILVTGGAGFIGSELVRQLRSEGHEVEVVDLPLDVAAPEVEPLLRRCPLVYHLAALGVRHSLRHPLANHRVNAEATLQLLLRSREAGVRRFVHVSTSEVYGPVVRVPIDEQHPTRPTTVYGASKLAGEAYARAVHGLDTVVVRPFNCFGPGSHHAGDRGEVIPRFLLRSLNGLPLIVFGDGSQTRDFNWVGDVAWGIKMAGRADCVGLTLNLCSGREVSLLELAALIGGSVEHQAARPGDTLRLCGDGSLAARVLGYRSTVTLEEGLERLRAQYRAQDFRALLREEVVRSWE